MGSLMSVHCEEPTGKKTPEALAPAVQPKLQTTGAVTQGDHRDHQLTVQNLVSMGGFEGNAWRLFLFPGLAVFCWVSLTMSSTQGNGSRPSTTEDFVPVEGWLGQQLGWGSSFLLEG